MQSRFIPCTRTEDNFARYANFAEYISATRERIKTCRTDLGGRRDELIIDANSPREFIPTEIPAKKGILLIHGLLDSPMMLQSLYDHFVKQGFLVRSLLLPGHGTRPADLLDVQLESWIDAVRYGIQSFEGAVEQLYLLGYSTGAGIALYHALQGARCDGLILFAPPNKLANPLTHLSRYLRALNYISPSAAWFLKADDNDYAKYQSLCYNGIYQVLRLSKLLQAAHDTPLTLPLFVVASSEDEAVNTKICLDYFTKQRPEKNRFILYSRHPKTYADSRIHVFPSHLPEQKILEFSHVALTCAPDHPHYGQHGDYQEFLHYQFYMARRLRPPASEIYKGAFSFANLRKYYLQRLTYNPWFAELTEALDQFTR